MIAGLVTAALLYRAGQPVPAMLACALTGLLVSPLSWDHHWVWVAPGIALLAHLGASAGRGLIRAAWWAAAAGLVLVFAAWPQFWDAQAGLTPAGLVWYGPGAPTSPPATSPGTTSSTGTACSCWPGTASCWPAWPGWRPWPWPPSCAARSTPGELGP